MNVKSILSTQQKICAKKERKLTFSSQLTYEHSVLYWGSNPESGNTGSRGKASFLALEDVLLVDNGGVKC